MLTFPPNLQLRRKISKIEEIYGEKGIYSIWYRKDLRRTINRSCRLNQRIQGEENILA